MEEKNKYLISAIVKDESGVLARIIGAFLRKCYNIDTLSVASIDDDCKVSRVNIVSNLSSNAIERVTLALKKEVPVFHIEAFLLKSDNVLSQNCIMIKITNNDKWQKDKDLISKQYAYSILLENDSIIIISLTANPNNTESFITLIRENYGFVSLINTGTIALTTDKNTPIDECYKEIKKYPTK